MSFDDFMSNFDLASMFPDEMNQMKSMMRFDGIMEMGQLIGTTDTRKHHSQIRKFLSEIGTDVEQNDADPQGDGDQSFIQEFMDRDYADNCYKAIKQLHARPLNKADSDFGNACIEGNVQGVRETIESICNELEQPHSRQHSLKVLLETRETGLRLSPLLMVVSMTAHLYDHPGKEILFPKQKQGLPTVAKLLLRAGADPDTKDALGKTSVHYCCGPNATPLSLKMADMCICASKTSDLYGKDVVLEGLFSVELNGQRGIVGGYDYDSNRRGVYLPELEKEVWVQPENIHLVDGLQREPRISLVNVQDRLGKIPLIIIMAGEEMWDTDRDDVAKFLVEKHHASIDIKDPNGSSPVSLSRDWKAKEGAHKVKGLIAAVTRKESKTLRDQKKAALNFCGNCRKLLEKEEEKKCAKCKVTFYCSRDCQVKHWKAGHKQECKELVAYAEGVKLSKEHLEDGYSSDKYHSPEGVKAGDKFVVSVVTYSGDTLHMTDQSETCRFTYKEGGPGFAQILEEVRKETAWEGTKTFMKASFDQAGDCTMYPATAGVKNKYTW